MLSLRLWTLVVLLGVVLNANAQINSTQAYADDYAYLGIYSTEVSSTKAKLLNYNNRYGSYVTKVLQGTSADKAGVYTLDYIYGIDDYRTNSDMNLTDILRKYKPGSKATLHIIRHKKPFALSITFGSRYDEPCGDEPCDENDPFFGVSPKDISEEEIGLTVNIIDHSTADEIGLENGDKLLSINGYAIIDWNDVSALINGMQVGQVIVVEFERDGRNSVAKGHIRSMNEARPLLTSYAEKRAHLKPAFLGVNIEILSKAKAQKLGFTNRYGSYVTNVVKGSAAEKAGLQPLDYIYGVNGVLVNEERNLGDIFDQFHAGDQANVQFYRAGNKMSLPVVFGSIDDKIEIKTDKCQIAFLGVTPSNDYIDIDGVKVNVVENASADKMGIKNGDIILAFNEFKILDWTDLSAFLNGKAPEDQISISLLRNGKNLTVRGELDSYCDTYPEKEVKTFNIITKEQSGEEETGGFSLPGDFREGSLVDMNRVEVMIADASLGDIEKLSIHRNSGLDVSNLSIDPIADKKRFQIKFFLETIGNTKVRVVNSGGRELYSYYLGEFSGGFSDVFNLGQNGYGDYFLEIEQSGAFYTQKITLK